MRKRFIETLVALCSAIMLMIFFTACGSEGNSQNTTIKGAVVEKIERQEFKMPTLEEMMASKVKTFLDRTQIRDVFDIEFLLRRGVELSASKKELTELKRLIKRFKAKDYKISLGSLLEFKDRQYYKTANFRYLLGRIESEISKQKDLLRVQE